MRRIVLLVFVAALATVGFLIARGSSGSAEQYRFAVVFDTARGAVAGQSVKVAGVVVGSIEKVELVPGPKARMTLKVQPRFAPFRANASCRILSEGLISENYVECEPGSVERGLPVGDDDLPTVPVEQTTVPTTLQDMLNVFSLPVDQRLRVIFTELGVMTAGRGEDLNALIRRSNPALQQSRTLLTIIGDQRRQLSTAVTESDRVLAELAGREDSVRAFVNNAAEAASESASESDRLSEGIQRLPAMLDSARSGLRSVNTAMSASTPLLADLRGAAPRLNTLFGTLPRFLDAGRPALESLGHTSRIGSDTARTALVLAKNLRLATRATRPFAASLNRLLVSTRDQGGLEGILRFFYSMATVLSGYDETSHLYGFATRTFAECIADGTRLGCDHDYSAPGNGTIPINSPDCGPQNGATWDPPTTCTAASRRAPRRGSDDDTRSGRSKSPDPAGQPGSPRPAPSGEEPEVASPTTPSPLAPLEDLTDDLPEVQLPPAREVDDLLDFLLAP